MILKLYNDIITSQNELDKNKNSGFLLSMLSILTDIYNTLASIINKEPILSDMNEKIDRCILLINNFIVINNDFIFMHKLKQLFQKVKINLSHERFYKLNDMILKFYIELSTLNRTLPSMIQSREYDVIQVMHLGGKYKKKYLKYKQKYLELKQT